MGSQLNLDSFTKLHLPPTYPSPSQQPSERAGVPNRIIPPPTTSVQTPSYISTITERVKNDIVKQEAEKKVPKPRKKRGQYRKTILKQQAAAAAAAAAAGLPPPQFPPLPTGSRKSSSTSAAPATPAAPAVAVQTEQPAALSTETPDTQPPTVSDAPSPITLELETELAMLAEEAEEDKKRREIEAADRILKRAQVVKHLRSLKSKLATAQIQIGHDLHYQSLDLFSQLYDEVLEDIGRDTDSEMLNLLKDPPNDQTHSDSDQEDSSRHHGYMHTRSFDRPKKRDLIPSQTKSLSGSARYHTPDHHRHKTYVEDDPDSESDSEPPRKIGQRNGSQFVGQSWDISSGQTRSPGSIHASHSRSSKSAIYLDVDDDDDLDADILRESHTTSIIHQSILDDREDLQRRQHKELDELQLQHRKEYEDLQRRQLDQLREVQRKHGEEIQRFEAGKTKEYQEKLEEMIEKRLRLSRTSFSRSNHSNVSRIRNRESYSNISHSYEFDNGLDHNPEHASSHSRSPSPTLSQRHPSRRYQESHPPSALAPADSDQIHSRDTVKSSSPTHSSRPMQGINGTINPLPMSTMTLALTAMNEKKKQLKRAMKKQLEMDENRDRDAEQFDHEYGDQQQASSSSQQQSTSHWNRKHVYTEVSTEYKRDASTTTKTGNGRSSTPISSISEHRYGSQLSQAARNPNIHGSVTPALEQESTASEDYGLTSPRLKARKRKNPSPTSIPPKRINDPSSKAANKANIGFNKTLLSHFDKWNPDEKTENFFDFVLSDPPDIDVDDTEVRGLLNGEKRPVEQEEQRDLNVTPTSNAFRWYQEQQKLAQELAQQPKIAPLQLTDTGDGNGEAAIASEAGTRLVLGDDPLAAFLNTRRKTSDTRKAPQSSSVAGDQHSGNQVGYTDPSPFLEASSAIQMLYSENGGDEWTFQNFTMDPTEEYLNHTPLNLE
ncbi:hypothetical protein B0O80DRAFT_498518 [Mortierella sp. GBAus27b]|nr:hypothetical protein B0O80DRAFT_498518 [Mortierella sp. GBAus27b]